MKIKELRNKTGLSQSKFAALFSIPVNTLQQWEQEVRTPPAYVVYIMRELLISKGYEFDNTVNLITRIKNEQRKNRISSSS